MRDLLPAPAEVEILGSNFAPSMIAVILGTIAMILTTRLLNHHRLFRYVFFPNLVMLAMVAIYTIVISTLLVPA